MARTKNCKRSTGGKAPQGIQVEKKPCTTHRRYSVITEGGRPIMNFSLKVANHVLQKSLTENNNSPTNMVLSPLSIDAVLNILALGCHGPTLEQLLELLGCNDVNEFNEMASGLADVLRESKGDDAPEISFANILWVDNKFPLKAPFREVLRTEFKTEAWPVDFNNKDEVKQIVSEVNIWAESISKGFIKQIISENMIAKDTMMLLLNALYFKGTWVKRFKTEETKDEEFYLLNGNKVQVPFIEQTHESFDYGTFERCQVLRMLYNEEEVEKGEKARSFSMYIFLPEQKDGLPNLMQNINIDASMFRDRIKLESTSIDKLSIPKFNFECQVQLSDPMKELGLTLPFDKHNKDLTGFVDFPVKSQGLYVTNVAQKCRVEVDEEGTKAVAFTRVHLATKAARRLTPPPPPINFVADHPFMFIIREDFSGAILFIGTVVDPQSTRVS